MEQALLALRMGTFWNFWLSILFWLVWSAPCRQGHVSSSQDQHRKCWSSCTQAQVAQGQRTEGIVRVVCRMCHVCVFAGFADEKVAELLTKIHMPIFVWLQAIWSSEKQHPSLLLLAVDVAWHSIARSGHSRAGQGYVYVKATVFGKPMRPKDRTDKELIELIHQGQLKGLSRKSKLCIEIHGLDFHIPLKLEQSKWAPGRIM